MNGKAPGGGSGGNQDQATHGSAATVHGVPLVPHMPQPVVAWLEEKLQRTTCFLEYGSGGSTRLAAAIGVPHIVSVESDRAFAAAVEAAVTAADSKSQCKVIHADIGRTKGWGYPTGFEGFQRWPNYALAPWDFVRANHLSPDFILIDGRFRVSCFLASLLEARPGTHILFDDYGDRVPRYGHVERFLKPAEQIDRSAIFIVPEKLPIRAVARALARFAIIPD